MNFLTFRRVAFPIALALFYILTANNSYAQKQKLHTLKIRNTSDLIDYFRYSGNDVPLISGHRGGIVKDFPENSIAALENILRHTHAFFEIDPRLTKDSIIVVFHDAKLERVTNGTGKLSDYTWEELRKLKLKDTYGQLTNYTIPTLDEVIEWSKGKTILNLDKKDVPLAMIAKKIKEHDAASHVMLTVHHVKEAQFYHKEDNRLMFSAHILSMESFHAFDQSGIPWSNIMAYIGPKLTSLNKALMDSLHSRGVMCMIGTGPSIDKITNAEERKKAYQELIEAGVNVIESDLPIEVNKAISHLAPQNSTKRKFFRRSKEMKRKAAS